MRSASPAFKQRLDSEVHSLCRLFRVTRTDGTALLFTDHDTPIELTDGTTYRDDISFDCSALSLAAVRGASQSVTITVKLSDDGFKEQDFRARMYQSAVVEVFVVDYRRPMSGVLKLFKGQFGNIKLVESTFAIIDLGSMTENESPTVAWEFYSPTCVVSLGDSRCGINIESLAVNFTLTAVNADKSVVATFTGADNYWAFGFIKWTAGSNAGLITPVRASTSTTAWLAYQPPKPAQIGDVGRIYPGCDKIITTCRDKFNNVVNFRGQPWVPNLQDINFNKTTVASRSTGGGNTIGPRS